MYVCLCNCTVIWLTLNDNSFGASCRLFRIKWTQQKRCIRECRGGDKTGDASFREKRLPQVLVVGMARRPWVSEDYRSKAVAGPRFSLSLFLSSVHLLPSSCLFVCHSPPRNSKRVAAPPKTPLWRGSPYLAFIRFHLKSYENQRKFRSFPFLPFSSSIFIVMFSPPPPLSFSLLFT